MAFRSTGHGSCSALPTTLHGTPLYPSTGHSDGPSTPVHELSASPHRRGNACSLPCAFRLGASANSGTCHTPLARPLQTMEFGTISSWEMSPGDVIAPGDLLAKVDTDKATVDFEAQDDGVLAKILVPAGTTDVPLGKAVAIIVESEDDVAAFEGVSAADFEGGADAAAPAPAPTPAPSPTPAPAPAPTPAPTPAPAPSSGQGRIFASPAAKRILRENGVDLESMRGAGTGPGGRVIAEDVTAALASGNFAQQAAAPEAPGAADVVAAADASALPAGADVVGGRGFTDFAVPAGVAESAAVFTASKAAVPHYYLTTEVRLDAVLALRQRLNATLASGKDAPADPVLSLNDVLVKAAGLALKRVPAVNSSWFGDAGIVRSYHYADVAVVMSTPHGTMAPVVRDADTTGLAGISSNVAELQAAAQGNALAPEQVAGATFTITNLGGYGVKQFAPIVVPPQACALGIGAVTRRVVPAEAAAEEAGGSKLTTATSLAVTLSCDHRVVDGAVGAEWLAAFKGLLEAPETMLL